MKKKAEIAAAIIPVVVVAAALVYNRQMSELTADRRGLFRRDRDKIRRSELDMFYRRPGRMVRRGAEHAQKLKPCSRAEFRQKKVLI